MRRQGDKYENRNYRCRESWVFLGKYFRLNNLEVTGYYDVNENLAKEAADFTATAFIKDLDTIVKKVILCFLLFLMI